MEDVAPTPQESASILKEDVAIAEEREFSVEVKNSVATVDRDRTFNDRAESNILEPLSNLELTQLPPVVVGVQEGVDLTGKFVRVISSGEKGKVIGKDGGNWQISLASTCTTTIVSFPDNELEIMPKPVSLISELVNTQKSPKRRTRVRRKLPVTSEPQRIRARHKPQGFGKVD